VPFFAELRPPEPEQLHPQAYVDHPWSRPEHWLPGVANVGAVIGRTDDTAVRLTFLDAYPRGATFQVRALLRPGSAEVLHHQHPMPFVGDLRVGMQWPDGRRVESSNDWHPSMHGQEAGAADDFHLAMYGGGGGGLSWAWDAWIWPLPPSGPVTLYCRWDGRGIPETATLLDLTPLVDAAAHAEELWPLPPVPEDGSFGWTSYSPMGTTFTAVAPEAGDADPSGDRPDPGDEHG